MTKKIIEQKDLRKHALYNELREEFDHWHVAFALRPNAAPDWWAPSDGVEDEAFRDAQDMFAGAVAEIIARYIENDDKEYVFNAACILVQCELVSIRNYADHVQHRMYDLELANYARDKFLNDLFDAVENEFGEI